MSTHNILFYREMEKIITKYFLISPLSQTSRTLGHCIQILSLCFQTLGHCNQTLGHSVHWHIVFSPKYFDRLI